MSETNENVKHLRQIIEHATMHEPTRTEAMVCLDLLEMDMRDATPASPPPEMKRYYMAVNTMLGSMYVESIEDDAGGWVGYADAKAALDVAATEITTLRATVAGLEKALAEALKYGAPENTTAHRRLVKCDHNDYWVTMSGDCMACRAVKAEKERDVAREALTEARDLLKKCLVMDKNPMGIMDRIGTALGGEAAAKARDGKGG